MSAPLNWQPDEDNNPDGMRWHQNSTKSIFSIVKGPENLPVKLDSMGPFLAKQAENMQTLESTDELSFGHDNYGYRYFLTFSSPSKLSESLSSSGIALDALIADMVRDPNDFPFKGMLLLTEKQGAIYVITFLSPGENFDSVLKELQPSFDSIQIE